MLDIHFIRAHPDEVDAAIRHKGVSLDLQDLLAVDRDLRALKQETEGLRARQKALSREISQAPKEERAALQTSARDLSDRLKDMEPRLREQEARLQQLLLQVPNIPDPQEPVGEGEDDNVELRRHGSPPDFDFQPRNHVDLLELHDWAEFERAGKVAGARSYILKGQAVYLEMAIWRMAIDLLLGRDFTLLSVPSFAREQALIGTGHFPSSRDDIYFLPKDDLYLSGTGEVGVNYLHSGEILSESQLPIRYAAFSPCFRREAGAAGRDTRGLIRVHQFYKVEQYVLAHHDREDSWRLFQEILHNAETLVQALELPYRIVRTCTGDMGLGKVRMWDIECWIPTLDRYRETHSVSELYDWQARRTSLRYRDGAGEVQFCYTLNNTAIATPRILVPLLENHQHGDGSIYIPVALRPYLGGCEVLRIGEQ